MFPNLHHNFFLLATMFAIIRKYMYVPQGATPHEIHHHSMLDNWWKEGTQSRELHAADSHLKVSASRTWQLAWCSNWSSSHRKLWQKEQRKIRPPVVKKTHCLNKAFNRQDRWKSNGNTLLKFYCQLLFIIYRMFIPFPFPPQHWSMKALCSTPQCFSSWIKKLSIYLSSNAFNY